jgi:hypothetical protein
MMPTRADTTTAATRTAVSGRDGVAAVTLERGVAGRGPQQPGQVAARGVTEHADPLRVDVVLVGVGAQPADRTLGVVDLGRERCVCGLAVARGGDHKAPLRQQEGDGQAALAAAADFLPAPAVEHEDRRGR